MKYNAPHVDFPPPKLKNGTNTHGQTYQDIFGPSLFDEQMKRREEEDSTDSSSTEKE